MAQAQWKGKEWYEIRAPEVFDEVKIAETPASDMAQVEGRTVTVDLASLVDNPSKYYYKFRFRVTDITGNTVKTKFIGHECSRDYLSRMVRRGTRRIDSRDTVELKDGTEIIVKTVATTIRPVQTTLQSKVRDKISSVIHTVTSQMTLDTFIEEMLDDNIQRMVRNETAKVYPLRDMEVRKTELVEEETQEE